MKTMLSFDVKAFKDLPIININLAEGQQKPTSAFENCNSFLMLSRRKITRTRRKLSHALSAPFQEPIFRKAWKNEIPNYTHA